MTETENKPAYVIEFANGIHFDTVLFRARLEALGWKFENMPPPDGPPGRSYDHDFLEALGASLTW